MTGMPWGSFLSQVQTALKISLRRQSVRFLASSNVNGHQFLKLSEEVQDAVHSGNAVVALESTIITHGMPYPHNFSTALTLERRVRESGAVPATVAVLDGKLRVGLNDTDLIWLAEKSSSLIKVSRRDLPYVLSKGLSGGTTVSATMIAAHMSNIPIFATGGIGGVHRGAESSFDVSADLTELGRTPVAVVSSGVKSILDIPKTLEYLETQGVCVVTFGGDRNFPAFFTRDSGHLAPYNVASHLEAAKMIGTKLDISLQSGTLIAVPIPEEFSAAGEVIQNAIKQAVEMARENNVKGKEVTPYILNVVNELTEGESLLANIALVENNASVAGGIANCLAQLQRGVPVDEVIIPPASISCSLSSSPALRSTVSGSSETVTQRDVANANNTKSVQEDDKSLSGRPVVIGATVVDLSLQVEESNLEFNGASYPGKSSQSFGGVGRNLADGLSRLACNPIFVSATGNDIHSSAFVADCSHMDLSAVKRLTSCSTAIYCPILLSTGQLLFGVGDMDINSKFNIDMVTDLSFAIETAPLVVVDGNFSPDFIEGVVSKCVQVGVPVWFEPTDIFKSKKPFETEAWKHLSFISPNLGELTSMHNALMRQVKGQIQEDERLDDSSSLERIIKVSVQMCRDLITYIPIVLLTLGQHGILLCHNFGDTTHLLPLPDAEVFSQLPQGSSFKAIYYPALNDEMDNSKIVSVSGAGDCLASAFIAGMLSGKEIEKCVKHGLLAASLSLRSNSAVPQTVSKEKIMEGDTLDRFSNWKPVDVSRS